MTQLATANSDPVKIKQLEDLTEELTKRCDELQVSVNFVTQASQRARMTGHDAPNDPPLNTAGITANTEASTTTTTKDVSTEAAKDGNVANPTAVKTSNAKGSGRDDPPDNQKKPSGKPWKPPKMQKKPFSRKNPPSGSGANGGNGGNGGNGRNGGNGPPNPPNGGGGGGDQDLHKRIEAKKPKMGGLTDRHHGKEAWVSGKPNHPWTGLEAPNAVDFPQPSQMQSSNTKAATGHLKCAKGTFAKEARRFKTGEDRRRSQ